MNIIISFCAECGSQLHTGDTKCENCNYPVEQRNKRLEGIFNQQDGNRMLVLFGDDPVI